MDDPGVEEMNEYFEMDKKNRNLNTRAQLEAARQSVY